MYIKYCIDGSIYRCKFPKVVLAYILSELDTFCIVLLRVPRSTCLPIFIEIG